MPPALLLAPPPPMLQREPRGRGGMVDARDLKSLGSDPVPVRVRPPAPSGRIRRSDRAASGLRDSTGCARSTASAPSLPADRRARAPRGTHRRTRRALPAAARAAPSAHAAAGTDAVAERSVVDGCGPALIGLPRPIPGTGCRPRYVAALMFHHRRGGSIRGLSLLPRGSIGRCRSGHNHSSHGRENHKRMHVCAPLFKLSPSRKVGVPRYRRKRRLFAA